MGDDWEEGNTPATSFGIAVVSMQNYMRMPYGKILSNCCGLATLTIFAPSL